MTCQNMANTFKFSLDDETFSDFTIHYGDRSQKVHKHLLYTRSGYFKKLFTSGFKESTANEIRLHDEHTDLVTLLLKHIYDVDVLHGYDSPNHDFLGPNLLDCFDVFMLADKYEVPSLREAVLKLVREADIYNLTGEQQNLVPAFAHAYALAEESTREFRDVLIRAAQNTMPNFLEYEGAADMLLKFPEVAKDFLDLMNTADRGYLLQVRKCGPCGKRIYFTRDDERDVLYCSWCKKASNDADYDGCVVGFQATGPFQ